MDASHPPERPLRKRAEDDDADAIPMRVLFLHNNFPSQFGPLARFLKDRGHDVAFGTQWKGEPPKWLRMIRFEPHRKVGEKQHPYLGFTEEAVLNGQAFARAAWKLKKEGYAPDVVVAHAGMGPGMYVRDVWPRAKYVGYFEWYYGAPGSDMGFLQPATADDLHTVRTSNGPILLDWAACDWGIVPTRFQAAQFPVALRGKLTVQHDGVDADYFAPRPGHRLKLPDLDLSHAEELVTYVTRGMEPYRGFPQAMAAFAAVQKRRPRAHVVIVGADRVAYGRKLPAGDTYKKKALRELDFDPARLHFTGVLPRNRYREVLLASSVHVYLTVPFVLSWSPLEALCAGCALVASNTPPVREAVTDGDNGLLVDFFDSDALADRVCDVLERTAGGDEALARMRARACRGIAERYTSRKLLPRRTQLLEAVATGLLGG